MKKHGKPFVKKSATARRMARKVGVPVIEMKPGTGKLEYVTEVAFATPGVHEAHEKLKIRFADNVDVSASQKLFEDSFGSHIGYNPNPSTSLDEAVDNAREMCKAGKQTVDLHFNGLAIPVCQNDSRDDVFDKWDKLKRDQTIAEAREGAGRQPDPIALKAELADYVKLRWRSVPKWVTEIGRGEYEGVDSHISLLFERDFWRAKALGTELP